MRIRLEHTDTNSAYTKKLVVEVENDGMKASRLRDFAIDTLARLGAEGVLLEMPLPPKLPAADVGLPGEVLP